MKPVTESITVSARLNNESPRGAALTDGDTDRGAGKQEGGAFARDARRAPSACPRGCLRGGAAPVAPAAPSAVQAGSRQTTAGRQALHYTPPTVKASTPAPQRAGPPSRSDARWEAHLWAQPGVARVTARGFLEGDGLPSCAAQGGTAAAQ